MINKRLGKNRIIAPVIIIVCVLSLGGCFNVNQNPPKVSPTAGAQIDDAVRVTVAPEMLEPVLLRTNLYAFGNGSALYPVVTGVSTSAAINRSIAQAVKNYADKYSYMLTGIKYEINYNDNGVLSIMLNAATQDSLTRFYPLNYDITTGELLTIDKLFSNTTEEWRTYLTDCVTVYATDNSIPLLAPVRSIENDRMFYLTANSLVLVYNLYEITTYSYGMPRVIVTYDKLSPYLEYGGIITRIAYLQGGQE